VYLLIDRGTIGLPGDALAQISDASAASQGEVAASLKTAHLAATQAYADMAKFWIAVGAALAIAIGLSKRSG